MTTINFTRRQFIGGTVLVAMAASVYYYRVGSVRAAHPAYLVGEISTETKNSGRIAAISNYAEIIRRWTIPFPVHFVAHNMGLAWQAAAFEARGNSLAIVDLRVQRRIEVIPCPEKMRFSGKGVFSVDGTKLYATAFDAETESGAILIYDTESFELKKKIASGGVRPSDIQLDIKKPEQLIVAHAGAKIDPSSNLTWMDESSEKIVQQMFPDQTAASISNFIQTDVAEIYAFGDQGDLGYYAPGFKEIRTTQEFSQRRSAITNGYFDSYRGNLWVSMTDDDTILVLQGKTLKKLKEFKALKPRSMIAVTPERPQTLMVSVEGAAKNEGMQRSYDLVELKGTDEALAHPQKFYGISATQLVVSLRDQ